MLPLRRLHKLLYYSGSLLLAVLFLTTWPRRLQAQQLVTDPILREQVIWAAVPDPAGWVWLATEHGAFRYDGSRLVPLADLVAAGPRPSSGTLTTALLDSVGTLWLGGPGGLWAYERRTRRLRVVPLPATSAIRPGITALAQHHGQLWIGLGTDPLTLCSLPLGQPAARPRLAYQHPNYAVVEFATTAAGRLEALNWASHHQLGADGKWRLQPGAAHQQVLLAAASQPSRWQSTPGWLALPGTRGRWRLAADGLYDAAGSLPRPLLTWHWDGVTIPLLRVVESDSTWYWSVGAQVYTLSLRGLRADRPPVVWQHTAPLPLGRELLLVPLPHTAALLGFRRDAPGAIRLAATPRIATPLRVAGGQPLSARSISRQADGALWVSTYQGLYRQAPDSLSAPLRLAASISQAGVWYSTLSLPGISWLAANELGDFLHWVPDGQQPLSWQSAGTSHHRMPHALCMLRDHRGKLWGGALAGLFELDLARGRVQRYRDADPTFPLHSCRLEDLAEGPAGVLWAATDRGLFRLEVATGRCWRYGPTEPRSRRLPTADIRCLLLTHPDSLWLGTFDHGLLLLHPRRGIVTCPSALSTASVASLAQSAPGTLWVGTYQGLAYYRPRSGRQRTLTTTDGLATNECNRHSLWLDSLRSTLYVGGVGGVSCLRLTRAGHLPETNALPPRLLLAALHWQKAAGALLACYPDPTRLPVLTLTPDDAFLDAQFALADFAPSQAARFTWRLVAAGGPASPWSALDSAGTVRLQHLAAGDYTLQVRAETSAGQPAANQLHLVVAVRPPWTRHPLIWAFAGLTLAVGVGTGVYGQQRFRATRLAAEQQLRARLAADLHDEVGNILTRVTLHAELARKLPESTRLDALLRESRTAAATIRDLIWTVDSSIDTVGALADRLQDLLIQGADLAGRRAHFTCEPEPFPVAARLRPNVRQQTYLLGREALTNALKHAPLHAALFVYLRVTNNELVLDVWQDSDSGASPPTLPPSRSGQGLRNMAARAQQLGGTLPMCGPTPNGGWRVVLCVPRPLA